jgi:hypothetical protein
MVNGMVEIKQETLEIILHTLVSEHGLIVSDGPENERWMIDHHEEIDDLEKVLGYQ